MQQVQYVQENFWVKVHQLYNAYFMDELIYTGTVKYSKSMLKTIESSVTSGKKEKGGTYQDTLDLYRQGISVAEIASVRGLAISTIKGHLAKWILEGEIDVRNVLPEDTVKVLERFIEQNNISTVSPLLTYFGDKYDAADMRMVINSVLHKKNNINQV